jgi:hypothetical protein
MSMVLMVLVKVEVVHGADTKEPLTNCMYRMIECILLPISTSEAKVVIVV